MYKYYNTNLFISSGDAYSNQIVSGTIQQLSRVQSVEIGIELPKEKIAFLDLQGKSVTIEKPYINLAIDYYPTNGSNEGLLGFITNGIDNAIKNIDIEKNIYTVFLDNGLEPNLYNGVDDSSFTTISFGNCILNSYTLNAQAGGVLSANCQFQALNMNIQTGVPSGKQIPTIDPATYSSYSGNYVLPVGSPLSSGDNGIKILGGKDITLNIGTGLAVGLNVSGNNSVILQNFSFNLGVNRNTIKELGKYIRERKTIFPLEFTVNTSAIVDKFQLINLNQLSCDGNQSNIDIIINQPCSTNSNLQFSFKKVKLESQSISQSISNLTKVDLQWKGYIYNFGTGCSYFSLYRYLPPPDYDALLTQNNLIFLTEDLHYITL